MTTELPSPLHARLLLVEDEEALRVTLALILRRAGYKVDAVADGETACRRLAQSEPGEPYDVVLTDLLLPDRDGTEILREARRLRNPPEVVILTGGATAQAIANASSLGAFDVLLKPCLPEQLLLCIATASRHQRNQRQYGNAK